MSVRTIVSLVLLFVSGLGFWVFTRVTPERLLQSGLTQLQQTRGMNPFQLDVSVTDLATRNTFGWTASGKANLEDLTHPEWEGSIRLAAPQSLESDRHFDVVLQKELVAVRPRDTGSETFLEAVALTGDRTGATFGSVNREELLERRQWTALRSGGTDAGIRTALASIASAWKKLALTTEEQAGIRRVTFELDPVRLEPVAISIVQAWAGTRNLKPTEYALAKRIALSVGDGAYVAEFELGTGTLKRVQGTFSVIRESDGMAIATGTFVINVGLSPSAVLIANPKPVKDVTGAFLRGSATTSLPTAGSRE